MVELLSKCLEKKKKDDCVEVGPIEFFLVETECVQTFMHVFIYAGTVPE